MDAERQAVERASQIVAIAEERKACAAFECRFVQTRGELREAALRSAKVWRTHCGEQPPVEIFRRKRDGDADDGAADGAVAQDFPEGLALAVHLDHGARVRRGGPYLRGRELGHVGSQAAVQEVEDVVARRADAGCERRPCNWRERRERGAQAVEGTLFPQTSQVGEFAFGHEALGEARVQPVKAQKDEALRAGVAEAAVAAEEFEGGSEGPEDERRRGQQE